MSIYLPKLNPNSLKFATRSLSVCTAGQIRGYASKAQTTNVESVKAAPKASQPLLTWPEYLAIRRSRHRWQTVATVPAAFLGLSAGITYFGSLETDPTKPIFGFDPFMVYGALTVVCAGFGALLGPTVGGSIWRMTHRQKLDQIDAKDREFLEHISKNRVNASLQSANSPMPDYYGERVGSLHQYRQWLRDQNKYRRKVLLPEKEF